MAYLIVRQHELEKLYAAFADLSRDARLALSIIVIVATYFGGAMYLGSSSGSLGVVIPSSRYEQVHILTHDCDAASQ